MSVVIIWADAKKDLRTNVKKAGGFFVLLLASHGTEKKSGKKNNIQQTNYRPASSPPVTLKSWTKSVEFEVEHYYYSASTDRIFCRT